MHFDGGTALTTEVVREVRTWLDSNVATHAFMQCAATTTFENNVNGRFITTTGMVDDGGTPTPLTNNAPDDLLTQYHGAIAGDTAQILAGLTPGTKVVTVGQGGLKQGARIKPVAF